MARAGFRKLTPSELKARGLSPKAERFIRLSDGATLSKRQYQQALLGATYGERVTLEQRARNFLSGLWRYVSSAAQRAALGRRKKRLSDNQLQQLDEVMASRNRRRSENDPKPRLIPREWDMFDDAVGEDEREIALSYMYAKEE
ncbi:MAG: hypothetical protein ACREBU_00555 [Nitrososphaera sp.]